MCCQFCCMWDVRFQRCSHFWTNPAVSACSFAFLCLTETMFHRAVNMGQVPYVWSEKVVQILADPTERTRPILGAVEVFAGSGNLSTALTTREVYTQSFALQVDPVLQNVLTEPGLRALLSAVLRVRAGGLCWLALPVPHGSGCPAVLPVEVQRIQMALLRDPMSRKQIRVLSWSPI